eukprot:911498-Pyramimonas_sp.AAC.1
MLTLFPTPANPRLTKSGCPLTESGWGMRVDLMLSGPPGGGPPPHHPHGFRGRFPRRGAEGDAEAG